MINNSVLNSSSIYICEKCNYKSCRKSQYNRHLQTDKHKKIINDNNLVQKVPNDFTCHCGKKYNYLSGLSRHRKTCKGEKKENIIISKQDNKDEMRELVFKLINENQEMRNLVIKQQDQIKEQSQQISEMIPKIGNNNTTNSNNKQKFNINVFLNEKCKDALSMEEFINKIEISMKNLLTTKEKGQVHGISNIIIENMNKLSLYERPMHCTDKKRETLYVKNDTWEKDDNKQHINKALKDVERKQMQNINVWLEEHPNYMNNSKEQEEFANLISECGKSVDDGREKIIKNVCDNVYLDKEDC